MPGGPPAAEPPAPPSGAAATAQSPQRQGGPDLYRFWSPLEAERLVRCVDEDEPEFRRQAAIPLPGLGCSGIPSEQDGRAGRRHRSKICLGSKLLRAPADLACLTPPLPCTASRQLLGSEALDWQAIGDHFSCSAQAVRSKYRLEQVGSWCAAALTLLNGGHRPLPETEWRGSGVHLVHASTCMDPSHLSPTLQVMKAENESGPRHKGGSARKAISCEAGGREDGAWAVQWAGHTLVQPPCSWCLNPGLPV